MSNSVVDLKIPLFGIGSFNPIELLKRLRPTGTNKVAVRFLQIFNDHGVAPSEIIQFVPTLSLADLEDVESLRNALNDEILSCAATLFGVRRSWLDGVDDQIFDGFCCYNAPHRLLDCLASLPHDVGQFPLRVLYSGKAPDSLRTSTQPLALVMVEEIKSLGHKIIERYRVCFDGWDWSHDPSRLQLKAMARFVHDNWRLPIPMHQVSSSALKLIREGWKVPREEVSGCLLTEPSLEDYALSKSESIKAREIEELDVLLRLARVVRDTGSL